MLGLSSGNGTIENLLRIEAFLKKNENPGESVALYKKLRAYLDVQAYAYEIKVQIHTEFVEKIAKSD